MTELLTIMEGHEAIAAIMVDRQNRTYTARLVPLAGNAWGWNENYVRRSAVRGNAIRDLLCVALHRGVVGTHGGWSADMIAERHALRIVPID